MAALEPGSARGLSIISYSGQEKVGKEEKKLKGHINRVGGTGKRPWRGEIVPEVGVKVLARRRAKGRKTRLTSGDKL